MATEPSASRRPRPIRIRAGCRRVASRESSGALQIAASDQLTGMERMLSWLASTGVVAPFIGLFGTVWGVMDSFHGLGTADSASLRAVAPGISEALVATAAGLFVAIPAVVAYNHFLHVLRDFGSGMDSFGPGIPERGGTRPGRLAGEARVHDGFPPTRGDARKVRSPTSTSPRSWTSCWCC